MGERAISVPPHQPAPGRLGNRRQRPADGVRQQGRDVVLRGGLQPRRGHRCAERRRGDFLPRAQGEDVVSGVRTPRDLSELRRLDAGGRRSADGDPAQARGPLQGHAGHRVHRRGGAPVHAADAERQAPRAGGCALRGRRLRGAAADEGRGASRRSTPARSTRSCTPRSTPTRATRCSRMGSRPRRVRRRARSCSPRRTPSQQAADGKRQ